MGIVDEVRVESSLPVVSRVSILDLANLDKFWWEHEGVHMKTMSQLVAYSLSALLGQIEDNDLLGEKISTVEEANRHLEERGLYQRSLLKRGKKKLNTALAFENLRREGIDPRRHVPSQYSMLHRGRDEGGRGVVSREELGRLVEIYEGIEAKEKKEEQKLTWEEVERLGRKGKVGGIKEGMNEEELSEYDRAREEEVLGRENAEIDKEELREQIVDD